MYSTTTEYDPTYSVKLPSMDEGQWVDIIARKLDLFESHIGGEYFEVKLYFRPCGEGVREYESVSLLIVAMHRSNWARNERLYDVTQILLPVLDFSTFSGKLQGISAARLGEWVLGETERRGVRRRQREGWLMKELREAIAAKLDALDES